jgi:HSP20 family protein
MPYLMRNAGLWNPWRRLRDLEEQFGRFFGEAPRTRATGFPAVNIHTNEDGAVITAELPGVDPGDLDVTARENALTLKGERKLSEPEGEAAWHRRERAGGRFTRVIELPFGIDPDSVEAKLDNGVLTVRLSRPQQERPRKIEVKVS